jgi:hypothetical protein
VPPDCPVSQQATTIQHATVDSDSGNSAAQCMTEVRAAKSEGTGLSGAARGQSSNGRLRSEPKRLGDVAAYQTLNSECPVAHQTVRFAHGQQPPQQLWKWLGAINTPQQPHSEPSKLSKHCIQYKRKDFTPRHIK